MQHSAFPVCICRLTLAWVSTETSTKLLGMPTYPDRYSSLLWTLSHANSSLCCPVSTVLSIVRRQLPSSSFVQLSDWRSLPTSGHVEISSPNPLSGFAPKQTKGSSAWRTTYIVLHYAHIPKDERKKMDPKAKQSIFLGYGSCIKGYRLYDTEKLRVFYSRDVIFNESRSIVE